MRTGVTEVRPDSGDTSVTFEQCRLMSVSEVRPDSGDTSVIFRQKSRTSFVREKRPDSLLRRTWLVNHLPHC